MQASRPQLPLQHYLDHQAFKTYLLDVGLLSNMNHIDPRILLEKEQLFKEFRGALTENYVAQTLTASLRKPLHYWKSMGKAEVDFLIEFNNRILPLEVKAGVSPQKKKHVGFCRKISIGSITPDFIIKFAKKRSCVECAIICT